MIVGFVGLVLLAAAFSTALMPVAVAFVCLVWGLTIYADATVRGRAVVDLRLAAVSILFGLGLLLMSLVGLAT